MSTSIKTTTTTSIKQKGNIPKKQLSEKNSKQITEIENILKSKPKTIVNNQPKSETPKNLKQPIKSNTTNKPTTTTNTTTNNNNNKKRKQDEISDDGKINKLEESDDESDEEIILDDNKNNNNSKDDNSDSETEKENITFEQLGVHPQICEACTKLGFKSPKEIQRDSIPWALKGRDIIGLAQTGSGKTAAFSIPVLQKLLEHPQSFFALVLVPTRELAFQISEQMSALGSVIGVRCCVLVGGIDTMQQSLALAKKPHIIIGTPGKVLYHLENTKGFNLRALKFLVMDEADRLFSMDFEEDINNILKVIPKERNTFLFSATMTSKVAKLQRASLNNPVKAQVATKYQTVDTLQQKYLLIPYKYKECYLAYIMSQIAGQSVIIFTSTCVASKKIALMLRNLGFGAIPINGDMDQSKRLASLNKFKAGDKPILVATDVAARGLDIPLVDLVINFDVPNNSKEYIHRVGRTARAGKSGKAIIFVTQYDIECFQRIEYVLGKKLEEYPSQEETVLILLERVQEAMRIAVNELKEVGEGGAGAEDSEERSHLQIKKRKVAPKSNFSKKKY